MIVVEGPDGSGKTSLMARLMPDLNLSVLPRAVNSNADYTVPLDQWVEDAQDRMDERIICDRHQLISHLMYGPTMRRTLFGRFQDDHWLTERLDDFWYGRPLVIICLPPLEVVKKNLEHDPHKVAQADIEVFYWNYHAWLCANRDRVMVVKWDYTTMDYSRLRREVSNTIAQEHWK